MNDERIYLERRAHKRFEPDDLNDDCEIVTSGELIEGIVGDVSRGGICIIILGDAPLQIGEEVCVSYRGTIIPAIVRNISSDAATNAYGLEWDEPQESLV